MQVPGSDEADIPGGDVLEKRTDVEAGLTKDDEIISNGSATPISENGKRKSPPIIKDTKADETVSLQKQTSNSSLSSKISRIMVKKTRYLNL